MNDVDVLVIGAGNAALCAALSASEAGATVSVLECAPKAERGGNTAFTAGAMRVAYKGVDELRLLMPDLSDDEIARTDFGSYSEEEFFDDMARVTEYRADPDLVDLLVRQSFDTVRWMASKGVRFLPLYGRQAFEVDGRFTFWGGLAVETAGGGPGLVDSLVSACERNDISIMYETRAVDLLMDGDDTVVGVRVSQEGKKRDIYSSSVVVASGGFEANAEWRARYLGPGWDLAKVRGTRFNNGDGIRMALDIGASPAGNWSGCHAVQWDRNAPEFGDLGVGDGFQKHSYPFGVIVNALGHRFLDEGADFRNYTYAKYGQEVLKQPGQVAWQVFDSQVSQLIRDEYRIAQATRVRSDTLEDLGRLMGIPSDVFIETIDEYNASIDQTVTFNPNVLDGRRTQGLAVPKSNWANTLSEPPFEAYQVTCGITFTFGGLRISKEAEVMDLSGRPIRGLFACGEVVGGLFYFNYPGGTGLTSGSVFGRIAGKAAANFTALRPT